MDMPQRCPAGPDMREHGRFITPPARHPCRHHLPCRLEALGGFPHPGQGAPCNQEDKPGCRTGRPVRRGTAGAWLSDVTFPDGVGRRRESASGIKAGGAMRPCPHASRDLAPRHQRGLMSEGSHRLRSRANWSRQVVRRHRQGTACPGRQGRAQDGTRPGVRDDRGNCRTRDDNAAGNQAERDPGSARMPKGDVFEHLFPRHFPPLISG